MLAKLSAFALSGIDAAPVEVEVDASAGQAKTVLVGLPELSVRESVHRIERALVNLGYRRPTGRTVINLAPASLPRTKLRGHPPRRSCTPATASARRTAGRPNPPPPPAGPRRSPSHPGTSWP